MRNIIQLLLAPMLMVAQVTSQIPAVFTAPVQAQSLTAVQNQNVNINIQSAIGLQAKLVHHDFDAEVLIPLRVAQEAKAKAEAEAKAQAAAVEQARLAAIYAAQHPAPAVVASGDAWLNLRYCESGNTYNRNSGNGFYGAYQFDIGTWGNYGGYARADLAPAEIQDAKAQETQARRGWGPWPACSRKLGLR